MSRRTFPSIVAVLLLAGLASATASLAQEDGRQVEVRSGEDRVRILLDREDGEARDRVSVAFTMPNGTLDVALASDGETRARLTVTFQALLEYRDENDNGTYEAGEPVVGGWPLAAVEAEDNRSDANTSSPWGVPVTTNATQAAVEGERVVVPGSFGDEGELRLELVAFGERVRLGNISLPPTGVKVTLAIESVGFQREDTSLALLFLVRAPAEQVSRQHQAPGEGERGFVTTQRVGDRTANLLFAWRATAEVGGQAETVSATRLTSPGDEEGGGDDEDGRRTGGQRSQNRTWQQDPVDQAEATTLHRYALSYPRGEPIVQEAKTEVAFGGGDRDGTPGWTSGVSLFALSAAILVRRASGR